MSLALANVEDAADAIELITAAVLTVVPFCLFNEESVAETEVCTTFCGTGTTVICVITVVVALGGEAMVSNELELTAEFTAGTRLDTKTVDDGAAPAADDIDTLDGKELTALELFDGMGGDTNLELLAATAVTIPVIVEAINPGALLLMTDCDRAEVVDPEILVLSLPLFCKVVDESWLMEVLV